MSPRSLPLAFALGAALAFGPAPAVSAKSAAECRAVPGLAPLFEASDGIVVFGEVHGTAEVPAFVANALCHALESRRAVTLALEMPETAQAGVDAYLASDGGDAARQALLALPFFTRAYQDGRSSAAMVALIEEARRHRAAGRPVALALFDLADPMKASAKGRDTDMAELLLAALEAAPDRLFLVLTGNYHSRIVEGAPWNAKFQPMVRTVQTALAGKRPLATLNLSSKGGEAWICLSDKAEDCGVRKTGGGKNEGDDWRVEIGDSPAAQGHHGYYHVGKLTVSPPATKSGG